METGGVSRVLRNEAVLIASAVLAVATMFLVPPSRGYLDYIDLDTLLILFCLMAAVAGMRWCNAFGVMAHSVLEGRMDTRRLCLLLVALPLVCSMFITNDVALIAFVPFTTTILLDIDRRDLLIPVIGLQTVGANLGSMATPFGNPQNIFVVSHYGPDVVDFTLTVAPFFLLGLVPLALLAMRVGHDPIHVAFDEKETVRHRPFLAVCVVLFAVAVLSVVGVLEPWIAAAVTLVTVLALRPSVLKDVDYSLLLTFVFMFVFAGNVASLDVVREAVGGLTDWSTFLTSLGLSQVVSNVPATVTLAGFTGDWQALICGADVGGFGTPVASMASLISLRLYMSIEGSDGMRYLRDTTLYNIALLLFLVPLGLLLFRSVRVAVDAGTVVPGRPLGQRLLRMTDGYEAERVQVPGDAQSVPDGLHPPLLGGHPYPARSEPEVRGLEQDVLHRRAHVLLPHPRDGHLGPDADRRYAERGPANRSSVGRGPGEHLDYGGVVHHHELPGVLVPGGGCGHRRLHQTADVLLGHLPVREVPDAAPGADGVHLRPPFFFWPGLYAFRYFRTSWSDSESDHSGV